MPAKPNKEDVKLERALRELEIAEANYNKAKKEYRLKQQLVDRLFNQKMRKGSRS